ncbi:MAG: hypothetical protein ABEJ94_03325, partial [Halorientalis sp.]
MLDNDGLPDTYERRVTGTAPLDADSDYQVTDADEADDGTRDGLEDPDGDALVTAQEWYVGTDPFETDTDGDGLDDLEETRLGGVLPYEADTDGDGVDDGAEDPDGDGLTNREELANDTPPGFADLDADGLTDPAEVGNGTDPTLADTDGDFLSDRAEIRGPFGTDPLDEDTDGDGIVDGNETYDTTATNETTGVSVTLSGQGNVAPGIEITPKPGYLNGSASVGPTVKIENRTAFDDATVEIPIDPSVPDREYDDLAILKWNGSVNGRWHPIDTTIENGTARATVESFSYFTVVDIDEWVNLSTAKARGQVANGTGEPLPLRSQPGFSCANVCRVENGTELILGGVPTSQPIVVRQGNRSYEIATMQNNNPISEFYGYAEAEINSIQPIAQSDTSQLMLWSGPNGVSLVVLNDKPQDGSGGAVTLEFSGLPADGSWVVEDDPGDHYSRQRADWAWTYDNTDGGAYRGGLRNETITITPHFNEEAAKEPLTPGQISSWVLAWGEAKSPRRQPLDVDEPVTIEIPGTPEEGGPNTGQATNGTATWKYSLPAQPTEKLSVLYQTQQTGQDPSVTLVARGDAGTVIREPLTVGTGGTINEIVNLTSLEGEVTITVRAVRINLQMQFAPRTSASLPDTDGDGIEDYIEERQWVLPTGSAEEFSTDPTDPDTDGDGFSDSQEVSFTTRGEDVVLSTVRADPTETDSDDDGLSDRAEWGDDSRTVRALRTEQAARRFFRALANTGSDTTPYQYVTNRTGGSDPLAADTDGDGLNDGREFTLGTNPSHPNTDRDLLSDGEEDALNSKWVDPTVHDWRPPSITRVYEASYENWARVQTETHRIIGPFGTVVATVELPTDPDVGTRYVLDFRVFDDGSIDYVRSVVEETRLDQVRLGRQAKERVRLVGSTRGATAVINSLSGGTAYVHLADEAGHTRRSVGVRRRNVVGTIVENIPEEQLPAGVDTFVASKFGVASGFTAGVGEIPTAVQGGARLASDIYDNPYAYAQALTNISNYRRIVGRVISNPVGLAQSMGEQYWNMQKRNNPYSDEVNDRELFNQLLSGNVDIDENERLYLAYARGWYKGYIGFSLLTGYVASGAAQVVRNSQRVGRVLSRVDDLASGRLSSTWRFYKKLKDPDTYVPDTVGTRLVARGVPGVELSDAKLRRALDQADTVGGKLDIAIRLRQVDTDLSGLSEAEAGQLGRLLRRTGDEGVEFADDVGSDTLKTLFRTCGGAGSAVLGLYAGAAVKPVGAASVGTAGDCPDGVSADLRDDVVEQANRLSSDLDDFSDEDKTTLTEMYANLDGSRDGGLTIEDVDKLGEAFDTADSVNTGPGSNPGELIQKLEYISEQGIDDFVDAGGTDSSRYKGIAGESDIVYTLLRTANDIDDDDIDMDQDEYHGISGAPNTKTEIDVEIDGTITVNGRTFNSPLIESKYYIPEGYSDYLVKEEAKALADKISTQNIMTRNRDEWIEKTEFVVTTTDEFLQELRRDRSGIS